MWTKSSYDGAGRDVMDYTTDGAGGTTWSGADSVAYDTVLEQEQSIYDGDGNVIETIDKQRFHNATGAGPLGTPTSGIGARVYYAAEYYDNVDRVIADVDAGTNGGTAWTRPSTVPSSSPTLLVTKYAYSYIATGPVLDVHDPMGIDAHYNYDNLGRETRIIQDFTGQAETTESDVSTSYFYDGDNHVAFVVANEPGGVYQQTRYIYGVTTAGGSGVNSNDILSAIEHPDPTSGKASVTQQDKYLSNALGDVVQSTDRNGNVHQYSYDVLGRLTSDNVTAFGVGVDSTIQQITYGYDSQGNVSLITSLKAGGNIANQVQRFYNGLGQLTTEYQAHNGAVDIPYTPAVQYAYNEMSNGQNNSRLVSMTYPDGYQLLYNYNSGLDSNISRLSSLSDSTGTLESYLYLGLNTVVERDHPQSGVNLSYIQQTGDTQYNSDGGDQYTGLDRFGRVIDQFWIDASNGTTVDRYQYGYNQDSEVVSRRNVVNTAMNETYTYDNLGQLTSFQRGAHSQSWTPDALGNFTGVTTDGNAQARTANQQNEYTSITGQSAPTYDGDGNLTADGAGNTYVYDAWNRLVTVKNDGTVVASYIYDGLNRRIQISESDSLTDSYYAWSDQVLENYQSSTVTFMAVWSPVYVNALVYSAKGNPLQRYYALQDANWNTTAWVQSGTVVEREAYDPFGAVTALSPSWGVQSSLLHLASGFQGMGYDWLVGLIFSDGERVYNPVLMRWEQTDPIGQSADVNPYRLEGNGPMDSVDPSGLQKELIAKNPGMLSPNWKDATGAMFYTEQKAAIKWDSLDEGVAKAIIDYVWDGMKNFRHFNGRNIAKARIIKNEKGEIFVGFTTNNPLKRAGQRCAAGDGPDGEVYVRLFIDEKNRIIRAVTLGNHMIVGVRIWMLTVVERPGKSGGKYLTLIISTRAYERRNGWPMNIGFQVCVHGPRTMKPLYWFQPVMRPTFRQITIGFISISLPWHSRDCPSDETCEIDRTHSQTTIYQWRRESMTLYSR